MLVCSLVSVAVEGRTSISPSASPATATPNFFSAARRVTDWARPLVILSNWLFITFVSFSSLADFVVRVHLRFMPQEQPEGNPREGQQRD